MKFTNEELSMIITAINTQFVRRIKYNAENGISSKDDKYIDLLNGISKKVQSELTKKLYEEE